MSTIRQSSSHASLRSAAGEEIFNEFQTVVHLSEDLKSNHVFVVMGASGDLAKVKYILDNLNLL
jgi:hypothetical protein